MEEVLNNPNFKVAYLGLVLVLLLFIMYYVSKSENLVGEHLVNNSNDWSLGNPVTVENKGGHSLVTGPLFYNSRNIPFPVASGISPFPYTAGYTDHV